MNLNEVFRKTKMRFFLLHFALRFHKRQTKGLKGFNEPVISDLFFTIFVF